MRFAQLPLYLGLAGCSGRAAPSFSLFGAYFPDWILCGVIGVLAAAAARLVLVRTNLAEVVPAQLFVCAGAGLIAACLAWLAMGH